MHIDLVFNIFVQLDDMHKLSMLRICKYWSHNLYSTFIKYKIDHDSTYAHSLIIRKSRDRNSDISTLAAYCRHHWNIFNTKQQLAIQNAIIYHMTVRSRCWIPLWKLPLIKKDFIKIFDEETTTLLLDT